MNVEFLGSQNNLACPYCCAPSAGECRLRKTIKYEMCNDAPHAESLRNLFLRLKQRDCRRQHRPRCVFQIWPAQGRAKLLPSFYIRETLSAGRKVIRPSRGGWFVQTPLHQIECNFRV